MRVTALLLVGALGVAACGTGSAPAPGLDGSPDLGLDADSSTGPTSTPDTVGDTAADPSDSDTVPATSDDRNDTGTPTAQEPAAADPSAGAATAACATLATAGYETRKALVASLDGDSVSSLTTSCPDDLERLNSAIEIEQRMVAFSANAAPLTASDLICDAGNFSLKITNEVDHPVGVHASLRLVRAEAADTQSPVGSTLQPLVIWSLEPGASASLTAEYLVNRGTDQGLTCEVDITAFDATPGDADASLGETRVPELAVDDPAAWLPFLVAQGGAIIGTGDADLAAVVEDVRSAGYPTVVRLVVDDDAVPVDTGTISVCSASIEQPSDRLMSVVYFDGLADASRLQHGLFRRGNDGQWRWLSSSAYFDSQEYWDCGTPTVDL